MQTENIARLEKLSSGGESQREVYEALRHCNIFARIAEYEPVLVGSIPLGIDTEGSDVDIICYYTDVHQFKAELVSQFGNEQGFTLNQSEMYGLETVTANFIINGLQFEIFGQNIPIQMQLGYRHMLIEETVLRSHGERFRRDVIELKKQGMKTEAAFCRLLGIDGNPYLKILGLEK